MAQNSFFDVSKIDQQAGQVDADLRWFALEGRRFGDTAPLPLKVQVTSGGDDWQRGWTKGAQSYARKLGPGERRRFNENSANPLTIDAAALPVANRAAIRESGALKKVALVGPVVDDLDAPLDSEEARAYGFHRLPEAVKAHYRQRVDGKWQIPIQAEPPGEFLATPEQVDQLLKHSDFVTQVGNARRLLVEEGAEALEEELGNFVGGSAGPGPGAGSPAASEPDSKS